MNVENTLHFMLLKAETALAKQLYLQLNELKLSPGQPKLLDYLSEHDGCIQKELAIACEVESATITNLLGRMEQANLIVRKQTDSDKRSINVFLTEKGRLAGTVIRERFAAIEEDAFQSFTPERKQLFLDMLSTVYKNLGIAKNNAPERAELS